MLVSWLRSAPRTSADRLHTPRIFFNYPSTRKPLITWRAFSFFTFYIPLFSYSSFFSSPALLPHTLFFESSLASLFFLFLSPTSFAPFTPPSSSRTHPGVQFSMANVCTGNFFHFHRPLWTTSRRGDKMEHLLQSDELYIRHSPPVLLLVLILFHTIIHLNHLVADCSVALATCK